MALRRPPSTIWEQKVDFASIERSQLARQAQMVVDLRRVLRSMESDTLSWVSTNLASKKLKTAIPKFTLTRKARYRSIVRQRLTAATRKGVSDVAGEVGQDTPRLRTADLSRVRARADALFDEHINRLEADLKREWSQAMFGNINKEQLVYVTRRVFADFAGWAQPSPPGN